MLSWAGKSDRDSSAQGRARRWVAIGACGGLLLAAATWAQEKPLARDFSVGATSRYRIQLKVRSELEGSRPIPIGAKTYVAPFSRSAEGQLSWRASRHVVAVGADGTAEMEETLDEFGGVQVGESGADEESKKLREAISRDLERWQPGAPLTLRYRETRAGQLLGLAPEGVPTLEEDSPRLVSLWLLRALRPTVALPPVPLRFGERWQEPRAAQLSNWTGVRGWESGEWLEALHSSEPAARLHVVQQISGTVILSAGRMPEGAAPSAAPANVEGRFHSESLNNLSLADARLLGATRAAAREIVWTLPPVEGLPERPQFRGRLSVEVQIEACSEAPCLSPGGAVLRQRD